METINDRMEALINERFDGNKAAFAKSIEMSPTSMSSYFGSKRHSKPSIDMVTKIVVNLHVNPMWLLTGEGSMFQEDDGNNEEVRRLNEEIIRLRAENDVLRELAGLQKRNGIKKDVG